MPNNAEKSVAAEIVRARISQLQSKLQDAANKAARTKEQYEELGRTIEELRKAGVPEDKIQRILERQNQRMQENESAVDEFNRIKARLTELQELVEILEGGEQ